MTSHTSPRSLAAAAAVAFLTLIPAHHAMAAQPLTGTASVIDGDTIEIHGQRIRLLAIDAPESRQVCQLNGKPWRCGQAAALALSDKIGRRSVRCDPQYRDRYKRVVAVCYSGGEDLAAWLVGQGMAVAYPRYGKQYVPAEAAARRAGRGVWAGQFVMPWEWRKGVR